VAASGTRVAAVGVERLDPERLEERGVPEGTPQGLARFRRAAVDRAEHDRELLDVRVLHPPRQQHRLPVLVRLGHGLHRQDVPVGVLEHSGVIVPGGASDGSRRRASASRRMRDGSLNQSAATRSLGSACFSTHDSPPSRSTSTVLFDTPPASTRTRGVSSGAMRFVSRR
jgi:hypothetical protein